MYVILPLLIAHLLGDFYFQTHGLAIEKNNQVKKLLLHSFIYLICVFVCLIIFYSTDVALSASIVVGISHLFIDFVTIRTKKKLYLNQATLKFERYVYLLDQAAHLAVIVAIALIYIYIGVYPSDLLFITPFDLTYGMVVVTCILLIGKPTNITIKNVITAYKPEEDNLTEYKNAGGLIGILERLLMLVFLFMNQYAALGLVLTAKSIARYNKISEDKAFGEYFLLGTLLSVIMVVVPASLLRYIF